MRQNLIIRQKSAISFINSPFPHYTSLVNTLHNCFLSPLTVQHWIEAFNVLENFPLRRALFRFECAQLFNFFFSIKNWFWIQQAYWLLFKGSCVLFHQRGRISERAVILNWILMSVTVENLHNLIAKREEKPRLKFIKHSRIQEVACGRLRQSRSLEMFGDLLRLELKLIFSKIFDKVY